MKKYKNILLFFSALIIALATIAQDAAEAKTTQKVKSVKNTFESVWLMDNQSVMVPIK